MSLPLNSVVCGDSAKVMAEWPENSVDCIVTDPPYGISFMSKNWDRALPPKAVFAEMYRVLKPGALAFVMSSPRQDVQWRMMALLEGVGFQLRQSHLSWIYRSGMPKAYDLSKGIDQKLGGNRKVIRKQTNFGDMGVRTYGTWAGEWNETEPASDLAKKWSGWKAQTGLKPAVEIILMVNKPRSEPTIVENVLKWGAGAINVDACRIPFQNKGEYEQIQKRADSTPSGFQTKYVGGVKPPTNYASGTDEKGRFPANLIISDGALDFLRPGETTKSGAILPHHKVGDKDGNRYNYGIYGDRKATPQFFPSDEGSPFRHFDLDAWAKHNGFLDVSKPSRAERDFGLWEYEKKDANKWNSGGIGQRRREAGIGMSRNIHPCVKPVRLMAYLIELGCPKGGVVVDPFLGSGTTCIAAKKLRRKWIGIEFDPEYVKIAEARINIRGPLDQFLENKEAAR